MKKKKEKWFHIAKEYIVSIFPNIYLIGAFAKGINKPAGKNLKYFAQKYENNSCQYLGKIFDWRAVSEPFANQILANPNKLAGVIKEIKSKISKLLSFAKSVSLLDYKKKTNAELLNYYNKFNALNKELYSWGLAIVLLDFQETTYISDALAKYLKGEVSEKKYSDYFSTLTTPNKRTVARIEELNSLKILKSIIKDKRAKNIILKFEANEVRKKLAKKNKKIIRILENHLKRFCWTTYVYEGPATQFENLIECLKELLLKKINPDKKIKEILKSEKDLALKQKKIIKALEPDIYHLKIIKLAQDVGHIKALRREQQSHSYYLIEGLLKEIAKRLNITVKQLRFILPEELGIILKGKERTDINKINQRIKLCILSLENGNKIKLLTGNQAEQFKKNIKEEKIDFNMKEIYGQTACTGKVKGRVKIINTPEDMAKMKDKDILVSFATNPNLMPAIRKASAIITDEGGLTCHAAIVSRELNIPCVVGLKIITQILKDGDLVEVDANKGVVRKIKK